MEHPRSSPSHPRAPAPGGRTPNQTARMKRHHLQSVGQVAPDGGQPSWRCMSNGLYDLHRNTAALASEDGANAATAVLAESAGTISLLGIDDTVNEHVWLGAERAQDMHRDINKAAHLAVGFVFASGILETRAFAHRLTPHHRDSALCKTSFVNSSVKIAANRSPMTRTIASRKCVWIGSRADGLNE